MEHHTFIVVTHICIHLPFDDTPAQTNFQLCALIKPFVNLFWRSLDSSFLFLFLLAWLSLSLYCLILFCCLVVSLVLFGVCLLFALLFLSIPMRECFVSLCLGFAFCGYIMNSTRNRTNTGIYSEYEEYNMMTTTVDEINAFFAALYIECVFVCIIQRPCMRSLDFSLGFDFVFCDYFPVALPSVVSLVLFSFLLCIFVRCVLFTSLL